MIVTSKRCFINVLAQFMDMDTLSKANYYIADMRDNPGSLMYNDKLEFDEHGRLISVPIPTMTTATPGLSRYNIKYGHGELDPSPNMTTLLMSNEYYSADPVEAFVKHLNQSDTMVAVYQFLYGDPPKGNGLRILLIYDEDVVKYYGHIICAYIAKNFGEDVSFIDAQYRPQLVKGCANYPGDKMFAMKTIKDIQDYSLILNFNNAISQMGYDESLSNLTVWLNTFKPDQLMHLYELLFPNDPLQPGNYTTDHIKQIIIGRVSDNLPKNPFGSQLSNLYMSDAYLDSLNDELDRLDH